MQATTMNGNIDARVTGGAKIETMAGGVRIRCESNGELDVSTRAGDVHTVFARGVRPARYSVYCSGGHTRRGE